jgi:hypothetical protein
LRERAVRRSYYAYSDNTECAEYLRRIGGIEAHRGYDKLGKVRDALMRSAKNQTNEKSERINPFPAKLSIKN